MISVLDAAPRLALDAQGLGQLKFQASSNPAGAARAAAQQFEALFVQMMLKSMRDASPQEGLFDDSNTRLYTGMLDSQLAQGMSKGRGLGLADMMLRQMRRQGVIPPDGTGNNRAPAAQTALQGGLARATPLQMVAVPTPKPLPARHLSEANTKMSSPVFSGPADFVHALLPEAAQAAGKLGVPAQFLLGHAALETAWGKREIRDAAGNNSHNLFGIKAGEGWQGAVVEARTTEYVNGVARTTTARFRAYGSYAESFNDYAELLRNSPRYASLFERPLDAAGFATGLQQGGYATDPRYARKLAGVIDGGTMQSALG